MGHSARRIAIVDDDASVLKALSRLLGARSFSPATYGSARAFLDSLQQGHPDCLIVDLQMPDMTGLELQRHLTTRGIHIPTIVITAHSDNNTLERCKSAGASDYLLKPLHRDTLVAAIGRATDRA
jgi:FixJ family two-component response regulator